MKKSGIEIKEIAHMVDPLISLYCQIAPSISEYGLIISEGRSAIISSRILYGVLEKRQEALPIYYIPSPRNLSVDKLKAVLEKEVPNLDEMDSNGKSVLICTEYVYSGGSICRIGQALEGYKVDFATVYLHVNPQHYQQFLPEDSRLFFGKQLLPAPPVYLNKRLRGLATILDEQFSDRETMEEIADLSELIDLVVNFISNRIESSI